MMPVMDIRTRKWLIILLSLAVALTLSGHLDEKAAAAPHLQATPFPTPTPGPDGRIVYIVQTNDTLLRISLISGVSVEELRGLNNLTGDDIIVGQELLLGLGGPSQVTPTPGPSPTPTELVPTPTPQPGTGILCILLYNDRNGDSIRQADEPSIPQGAISINNLSGSVSLSVTTAEGLDPSCFEDLPEGKFTISVAIPDGYNPTTISTYSVDLGAGDETYVDFGAQENTQTQIEAPAPTGSGRSPVLGIAGGVILILGLALALFAGRLIKG